MLPMWIRSGRPISIPLGRKHSLSLPAFPLLPALLVISVLLIVVKLWRPTLDHDPYTGRTVSKFLFPPQDIMAPPPLPPPPHYIPTPIAPKKPGMVVPNSVHYVYGLKPPKEDKVEELPYYAYLAIRSAIVRLQPERIYFHYKYLPTGPWWDLLLPQLTLVETVSPDSILGRKISHFAHKADVLRLLAMKHAGGIYLDIDMFVTKSFDDLLYFPTTLAMEEATESYRNDTDPQGLCWNQHSVVQPWILARRYPNLVQVLNIRSMFWPMWYGNEVEKIHERDEWDFYASGQYAYHAWESLAMKYLRVLSPKSIRETDTSFHRLVRPLIGPDDDAVYARWKGSE